MTALQALYGFLGVFAVSLGTYLAAQVAGRVSKHATDVTADLTKEANAVSGFRDLVTDLQEEMQGLRQRLTTCEGEVAKLQRESRRKDSLIRHLIAYVQTLRNRLSVAGLPVPEAPAGLDHEGGPLA